MQRDQPPKKWFGPKRIGWGLRPQTWQGRVVVLAAAAVVVFVTRVVFHLHGHHLF